MVAPEALGPAGDSYRLEKHSAFFVWALLAVGMGVNLAFPPAAFALLPFAFLFTKWNPYRFLVLWIASALFFFETYRSTFLFVSVPDALGFVYAFTLLLFALPGGLRFRVPMNAALLPLYLVILLAVALTPLSLGSTKIFFLLYDLKIMFFMALIPVLLAIEGEARAPKKVFLLLGAVIAFSALHAFELVLRFTLLGQTRPFTWSGIFMASAVIFSVLLLRLPFSRMTRWQLRAGLALCVLGLLITQTRGLWLSTLACLSLVFLGSLMRMRGPRLGFLLRFTLAGALVLVAANFAFLALAGRSLTGFLVERLGELEWVQLIDPYSSIGYRLHESWAVWDERTFWGHGPGATINLFFTQLRGGEFMDWWSIHSGYFELLHKYGFVGLFLWGWMTTALFLLGRRVARRGGAWNRAAGTAVQLMLLNHAIYSITSNEFNRPTSPIMWYLAFYITYSLGSGGTRRKEPASAS